MSVTVKTFARLADAAGALSSERGARFLAGGTLVMRAVNEADPAIETIVRSTDPTFSHISASSGRVELGAGVTMAAILAERELAFLHPVARAVGGPAVREAATVGEFVRAVTLRRFRGSAARPRCDGRVRRRLRPARSAARRISPWPRSRATLVASVAFKRPVAQTFRFAKSPAFIPRASRCFRSPPSCRSPAAGSTARGSPITPWTKLRFVPKLRSALSKAARSRPPA